jgi:hypothetical protein
MRGAGWRSLWLGVALLGLIGCVTTPPDPKPPQRPDEFVAPPDNDPRAADPRAAYPRETMNRLDGTRKLVPTMQNGLKGPGGPGMGGPMGPGSGMGAGPGGY